MDRRYHMETCYVDSDDEMVTETMIREIIIIVTLPIICV